MDATIIIDNEGGSRLRIFSFDGVEKCSPLLDYPLPDPVDMEDDIRINELAEAVLTVVGVAAEDHAEDCGIDSLSSATAANWRSVLTDCAKQALRPHS